MSARPPARNGRGILVAGTSSDAGKSILVAGLCRALSRRHVAVAPYKAQNMSNNSMVCADGSEIGRAQYLQAQAARVPAESAMNPVLLKPGTDRRAFVVVRGLPAGTLEAGEYATGRRHLAEAAYAAYEDLASRFDVVVCEGAGSPAEINLRSGDYVNMGLARRYGLPVVVVGDIDRGGILASLYGTWAVLADADRALLRAFVVNKFRGDVEVLRPGLAEITRRTGLPFLGVVPWLEGLWIDGEDALEVARWRDGNTLGARSPGGPRGQDGRGAAPDEREPLRVAVVRFPRISNHTDVDALAAEPGIDVHATTDPERCATADLLVLPGTRSTTEDLAWLRARGLAEVVEHRAATGRPVLGICGGYQMLAGRIADEVEGRRGDVAGLGLLPVTVRFGTGKILGRPEGAWQGHVVEGYEIHHGVAVPARPGTGDEPFLDGWQRGPVWGTMWHGTLENDDFRRAWLTRIAGQAGSAWCPDPRATGFAARREGMIDTVADALETHVDLDALLAMATTAAPASPSAPLTDRIPLSAPAPQPEPEPDLRHHGDADLRDGLVDLAVNVRLTRPPEWLEAVLRDSLTRIARYPDPAPARSALAARHRVPADMILPTAGGAEAFTLVARALAARHPVVVHPQFTEAEAALRTAGHAVTRHLLSPDTGFVLDPNDVPDAADLVLVGNPTNPTGVLHPAADLRALRRPGRVLVVDEAFIDAVPEEAESLVGPDMSDVLVLRSLTKTWGLAGLRAGYVVGDPALVARLATQQPPWSVSSPALAAMVACSCRDALAEASAAATRLPHLRAHLIGRLQALRTRVVASSRAPFVLFDTSPLTPRPLQAALAERGFAVRRGDTFPGLGPTWLRVAVRDEDVSDAFAAALGAVAAGPDTGEPGGHQMP